MPAFQHGLLLLRMQQGIATCYPLRYIQAKTQHTHKLQAFGNMQQLLPRVTSLPLNSTGEALSCKTYLKHIFTPPKRSQKHHYVAPCLRFGLGLRHCLGLRRCSFHDYPPQQMQNSFRLCLGAEMLTMNDHFAAANEPGKNKTMQLCFHQFLSLGAPAT